MKRVLAVLPIAILCQAQTVIGLYPTFPSGGPLDGRSPVQQAQYLQSLGVTLAGGLFEDDATPDALRAAGIKTMGLVVLFQGEQHWTSHPESRPIMADGRPLFKDDWYAGVCPNQEWLRRQKMAEIEAMLRSGRYDVINLDFIRYPVRWEPAKPKMPDTCYCDVCLRKFQRDVGVEIPASTQSSRESATFIQTNHLDVWLQWRADQITNFCKEVADLRDRVRPGVQISLAALPWRPDDHDNAVFRIAGQDFQALAEVVDVFNPMSYYLLSNRPISWIGEINEYFVRITGRPVWPFVIYPPRHPELLDGVTAEDWDAVYSQALSGGSTGLIAFPFERMPGQVGFEVFQRRFAAQ